MSSRAWVAGGRRGEVAGGRWFSEHTGIIMCDENKIETQEWLVKRPWGVYAGGLLSVEWIIAWNEIYCIICLPHLFTRTHTPNIIPLCTMAAPHWHVASSCRLSWLKTDQSANPLPVNCPLPPPPAVHCGKSKISAPAPLGWISAPPPTST